MQRDAPDLRRWDTDTTGRGVADAADLVPDTERLVEAMARGHWIAEAPEVHLLPHLEQACAEPRSELRLTGASADAGTYVVHLEPVTAFPDRRSRRVAVYRLVASIAEGRTLVREDPSTGDFDVVTGVLDGDTEFAGHGHRLRLILTERPIQS